MNYLCDRETHQVLAGPFRTWQEVADLIERQEHKEKFCNMTRFLLAKEGKYPNNKRGNAALERDLRESKFKEKT